MTGRKASDGGVISGPSPNGRWKNMVSVDKSSVQFNRATCSKMGLILWGKKRAGRHRGGDLLFISPVQTKKHHRSDWGMTVGNDKDDFSSFLIRKDQQQAEEMIFDAAVSHPQGCGTNLGEMI